MNNICIALPSKPLNVIALSDADSASALSLVRQKLQDAQGEIEFGREETAYVERLGGRAEDLESVSQIVWLYSSHSTDSYAARSQSAKRHGCQARGRRHYPPWCRRIA